MFDEHVILGNPPNPKNVRTEGRASLTAWHTLEYALPPGWMAIQ